METKDSIEREYPSRHAHQPSLVAVPVPHEGIGLALRCAYLPRSKDMPDEIETLLNQLR